MPWSRPFEDPITLPNDKMLFTLRDAGDYITSLPEAEQQLEEWQTAIGCLIGAAEGRDFVMHARIGVLRALNRNIERTLTDRKEMHWGAGSSRGINDNRLDLCRRVGHPEHLKVFTDEEAANRWLEENDPEGVAFEYDVIEADSLERH